MSDSITVAEAALWFALIVSASIRVGWLLASKRHYHRGFVDGRANERLFHHCKNKEQHP